MRLDCTYRVEYLRSLQDLERIPRIKEPGIYDRIVYIDKAVVYDRTSGWGRGELMYVVVWEVCVEVREGGGG